MSRREIIVLEVLGSSVDRRWLVKYSLRRTAEVLRQRHCVILGGDTLSSLLFFCFSVSLRDISELLRPSVCS